MPQTLPSTPRADGFFMPAEWGPHAATWMLFPHRSDVWREGAKPAQKAWVQVAAAISQFEPVMVGARAADYAIARAMLPPQVRVLEMSSNDAWMRDSGATFLKHPDGRVRGVQWGFNAWGGLKGGLYFPWDQDQWVAQKMLEAAGVDRYQAPFILEGGAIHSDGAGTILTTAECLLNPNRNPEMSQAQLEAGLCDYLGAEKVIWLPLGLHGDETDGHIDNLACFVREGVVALAWTDDKSSPHYEPCQAAYAALQAAQDAKGRKLEVHKIPLPSRLLVTEEEAAGVDRLPGVTVYTAGEALPASYLNFYICNGGVVMPLYGVEEDKSAARALRNLFPERKVVGVYARDILLGGGSVHCITQQQVG
jgi:agmatine deiminase